MNKVTKSFEHYPIGTKGYYFKYNDGKFEIIETTIKDACIKEGSLEVTYEVRDTNYKWLEINTHIRERLIFLSKKDLIESLLYKVHLLITFELDDEWETIGRETTKGWFAKIRELTEKIQRILK